MKQLSILALALSTTLFGCNTFGNEDDCGDCPGACTFDLRYIIINIQDTDGNPVELAAYNVIIKKTNEELNITFKSSDKGRYVIAGDNHMDKLACNGTKVEFNYSLDGVKYNSETFLIGKDCCHIKWRDNKHQEIIIE